MFELAIILFLILCIIMILIMYISKNNKYNPNRWGVLLTTAVNNDESRKKLYINSIQKWLDNTPYDIFVVESSQYTFPEIRHERFHIYSFQVGYSDSSSYKEAASILYLLDRVKDEPKWASCSHILKVTGRYYLDGITDVLYDIDLGYDMYLQIHRKNKWQNSEYFGIRKEMLRTLIKNVLNDSNHFEEKLYEFSEDKKTIQFGPFENSIARGGDGLVIEDL